MNATTLQTSLDLDLETGSRGSCNDPGTPHRLNPTTITSPVFGQRPTSDIVKSFQGSVVITRTSTCST